GGTGGGSVYVDNVHIIGENTQSLDVTPPTDPFVRRISSNSSRVRLEWDANPAEDGVVGYNIYRHEAAMNASTAVRLNGDTLIINQNDEFEDYTMQTDVSYTFFVTAVDAAGNESKASNTKTRTLTESKSPESPMALFIDETPGSQRLRWWAVSNYDVVAYRVYQKTETDADFVELTPANEAHGFSFFDLSFDPETNIEFYVEAVDFSGNISAPSAIFTFEPNEIPFFLQNPIGDLFVSNGESFEYDVSSLAIDPNGDLLLFSKWNRDIGFGADWLTVNSNGIIRGQPQSSELGKHAWIIGVEDGRGGISTTLVNIIVGPAQPSVVLVDYAGRTGFSENIRDGGMGSNTGELPAGSVWQTISSYPGKPGSISVGEGSLGVPDNLYLVFNGGLIFGQDTGHVITGEESAFTLQFSWLDGWAWTPGMSIIAQLYYTDDNLIDGDPTIVGTLSAKQKINDLWETVSLTDESVSFGPGAIGKNLFLRFTDTGANENKFCRIDNIYLEILNTDPNEAINTFRNDYALAADASEDLLDRSNNGVSNIAYYLFGLGNPANVVVDPIWSNDPGMPVAVLDTDSELTYSLSWNKDSGNYYYEVLVSNDMIDWWNATSADSPAQLLEPSTLIPSSDPDYDLRQFSFAATDEPLFIRVKLSSIPTN
ncbi:MAG: hypothetical protein AAF212_12735, partial [Verrucomicrobiota bacterium]